MSNKRPIPRKIGANMGRTSSSYSPFQTRLILLEKNGQSRIIPFMEHRALKEELSVRNSEEFPFKALLKVYILLFSIFTRIYISYK